MLPEQGGHVAFLTGVAENIHQMWCRWQHRTRVWPDGSGCRLSCEGGEINLTGEHPVCPTTQTKWVWANSCVALSVNFVSDRNSFCWPPRFSQSELCTFSFATTQGKYVQERQIVQTILGFIRFVLASSYTNTVLDQGRAGRVLSCVESAQRPVTNPTHPQPPSHPPTLEHPVQCDAESTCDS